LSGALNLAVSWLGYQILSLSCREIMRLNSSLSYVSAALCVAACVNASAALDDLGAGFWGFTGPWDPQSATAIAEHGDALEAVVSGWMALDSLNGDPTLLYSDSVVRKRVGKRSMLLVTSWMVDGFHARPIRVLGSDRSALDRTAHKIVDQAATLGYRGIILDFENLTPADLGSLLKIVSVISDSARARGVGPISVAVIAADTVSYPGQALIAAGADFILPMLYDQHWSTSPPGAISAPDWAREQLTMRIAEVGPSRIVAGLPLYGYQWRVGEPTLAVGYREVLRITAESGVPLLRDAETLNLRARLPGTWEIWVTDAELLRSLVRMSEELGVHKFALWRLGQEDPAIWRNVVR
jgi:spore germination protein YaaH